MTYMLHPEAESDISAALDFYSEQAVARSPNVF